VPRTMPITAALMIGVAIGRGVDDDDDVGDDVIWDGSVDDAI